jgi:myo-inositol 2-dehydrogenase/D-chiro-inositol 1-dehydrogenase
MSPQDGLSRRKFIQTGAAAGALGVAGCAATGKKTPDHVPLVEPARLPSGGVAKKPVQGDRIRVAFIAIGGRGGGLLQEVVKFDNVDIVALCDLDEKRTKWAAGVVEEKHKNRPNFKKPDQVFGDKDAYKQLLKRTDIDAIVSAAYCSEHARIYLDCLAAGKHTYGEKPMCIAVKEGKDLIAAEAKSPAILQIGFQWQWNPRWSESIKLVQSGELGELIEGRVAWSNAWGPPGPAWFGKRALSGDWMLEQACHSWNILNWLTGSIAQWAWGTGRQDIFTDKQPDRDTTEYYVAIIGYPKNLTIDFLHTWIAPQGGGFDYRYERVVGRKGGAELNSGTIVYRNRENNIQRVGSDVNDTYEAFKAFFECCKTGKQPAAGVIQGANASYVGLLVRKAVYEKRFVTMEEIMKEA